MPRDPLSGEPAAGCCDRRETRSERSLLASTHKTKPILDSAHQRFLRPDGKSRHEDELTEAVPPEPGGPEPRHTTGHDRAGRLTDVAGAPTLRDLPTTASDAARNGSDRIGEQTQAGLGRDLPGPVRPGRNRQGERQAAGDPLSARHLAAQDPNRAQQDEGGDAGSSDTPLAQPAHARARRRALPRAGRSSGQPGEQTPGRSGFGFPGSAIFGRRRCQTTSTP